MANDQLPHRFVFVFGLLFGGGLVFLSPPFCAPDENAHFYRAYHCSEGKLYAAKRVGVTGDDLPLSLSDLWNASYAVDGSKLRFKITPATIDKAAHIALAPARRGYTIFSNTALYSPVPYLPQSAAIWAARLVEAPPFWMSYAARAANLLVYLLMATAAVRLTPILKWTLALVALMPMSVFLAASLSADAATIGLSLLFIALTLKLAVGSERPRGRAFLALGFLLMLLALSKQAYIGMAVCFFVIPPNKFSGPRQRWLLAALLIGVPLAVDAVWTYSLRGLYVPMRPLVDPPAQLRWIIGHPWKFTEGLLRALYQLQNYSLMIGSFAELGTQLPHWLRDAYWAALGITAVLDGGKPLPLNFRTKAMAFGTYLFAAAVMATFIHLSWEKVGTKGIDGVQPRYFLPIIALVFLLPRGGMNLISSQFARAAVPVTAIMMSVLAAGTTYWLLSKHIDPEVFSAGWTLARGWIGF